MDAVEDIKNRLSIDDVVSEYVQLKRSGSNWKGLSPFTNERTPSLMVSPQKQIWHDFSSGRGGDMFSFVMEMEGLDFKGALELLARKAGVDLEQYRHSKGQDGQRGKEKERLYTVLEMAAKFYQVQFSKHRPALEYVLQKRAYTKQTALEWRLGYSPQDGTALTSALRSKGFSDQEIKKAGLSAQRYRGVGDMFRGRLMIPLADPQGRVIGFTARLLKDDPNAPKYINTPATPLYDKSRHVFGLHLAKDAIRKSKFVVVAEGNLDVIASHQAGVRQVVATAGTALTENHLKTLGRFTPDIRLCFDADAAGLSATERSIPLASKTGATLNIVTIPSGKDPDELIRHNAATWEKIIAKPQYALDWLIERHVRQSDLSSGAGKRSLTDNVLSVVGGLSDPVEQDHYIGRLSELIGVSREALFAKLKNQQAAERPAKKRPSHPQKTFDKSTAEQLKLQNHLLAIALLRPEHRPTLQVIKPQMLAGDPAGELLDYLQKVSNAGVNNSEQIAPLLPHLEDYGKMLSLLFEELYQNVEPAELRLEAQRLARNLVHRYVHLQKQRIAHELASAPEPRATALLEAAKKLDALLKSPKS